MTVAIIIKESAARAPPRRPAVCKPCLYCDVAKGSISIVLVKNILAIVSNEDIFKAIVVIVRDRYRACPPSAMESGLVRYIRECSVSVVLVETVCRSWNRFNPSSAEQKNIQPAVIIVVEKGNSASDRFEDELLAVDASINDWRDKPG